MAELSDEVKILIVTQLARHRTPTQVALAVKEIFNVEVSRQGVHYYDASRPGSTLPPRWTKLFNAERKRYYTAAKQEVAGLNMKFRAAELLEMYFAAKAKGQTKLAAGLLEQMAREEGGMYTNAKRDAGDGPKEIHLHLGYGAVPDEVPENREALAESKAGAA